MKRGQLLGMPLVLLFALIVGAMVLAWGTYTVIDLIGQADYVDLLDQIDDLENNVEAMGNYDKGSSKVYELNFPAAAEYICFYDSSETGECSLDGGSCTQELTDGLSLFLQSGFNVYVYPYAEFERSGFGIESFSPEGGNPVCVSNGGSVLIKKQDGYVSVENYAQ